MVDKKATCFKEENGLTTSSSKAETVITMDEEYPLNKRMKGPKMKTVISNKLTVSLDMVRLSDCGAALVLTPALQSLDHEPTYVFLQLLINKARTN